MRLAELIFDFRLRADDRRAPYLWSDDDVKQYFSQAESEAAQRAGLLSGSDEISLSTGDVTASLPPDVFEIRYAEITLGESSYRELVPTSRQVLDAESPGWRHSTGQPHKYIHDDGSIRLDSTVDAPCTLYIEYLRTPSATLSSDDDEPEIAAQHHVHLVHWALFCAYSKPDADGANKDKAIQAEAEFTKYFGARKTADLRKRQNRNRPHRNTAHF